MAFTEVDYLNGGGGEENSEIVYSTMATGGWQPLAMISKESVNVYTGLADLTGDIISATIPSSGSVIVTALKPCTIYYAQSATGGSPVSTTQATLSTGQTLTLSVTTQAQTFLYAVA